MADKTPAQQSRTEYRMEAAERARKALLLRTQRVSFDDIAKTCGYASKGAAYNAVKRELNKIPREAAKELRTVELEKLDRAERAIALRVNNGDVQAIDRMLKITDMRARLSGLYEEVADTGVDEVKLVLAAWLSKVQTTADLDDDDDERDEV